MRKLAVLFALILSSVACALESPAQNNGGDPANSKGDKKPEAPNGAAAAPLASDYRPDAASVQWCGPAYRYPQAGWIVLHIEGEPHERGVQHGKLMSHEIVEYMRCMAEHHSARAPMDAWHQLRTLVNANFVRRFDREYLDEMQGIADGANAAGGRFDGREIDVTDIATLNIWAELMTMDSALDALPTGLEGARFEDERKPKVERCSAFAATGPATADGKIVFGHITMYELNPSSFFNVWLDVKPAKGHRVLMQSYPAGMQSGMDYYINSAGLMVCETTISQTRYDINGLSLSSQIRKAMQYSDSIDAFVETLKQPGNGLYTNEWLIGDAKTNEIAMFEQGTHAFKLWRSSKNEWFGGTEGFYWGCNNTKDREVRLETFASVKERPVNMVFHPSDRDLVWVNLYQTHKGKIDASFGREAFTTPPIASYSSVDAKYTTTDMAKELKTWALFGPPMGRSWQPAQWERERHPAVKPLLTNPWTILHGFPPGPKAVEGEPKAADMGGEHHFGGHGHTGKIEWHGTLLPKTDADTWLAAAFADYQDFCAHERNKGDAARTLLSHRAGYLRGVRESGDAPLSQIKSTSATDAWYKTSAAKGFFLLNELRATMGDKLFGETMESFGTKHAGQEVTTADFVAHVEKAAGKSLKPFFDYWLTQTGLPRLKINSAVVRDGLKEKKEKAFVVEGVIAADGGPIPVNLEATIETAKGEETRALHPDAEGKFKFESDSKPVRLIVDKYRQAAIANGGVFTLATYASDLNEALIVYGTEYEGAVNAETAEELQKALIRRGSNVTVAIRSDKDVTEAELRSHNLLLIGRPECNRISRAQAGAFPVTFGVSSFRVGKTLFAHPDSAVVAVAANPLDGRYCSILIAGLSASATYHTAPRFGYGDGSGEVAIFEHGGGVHSLVLPIAELVKEFSDGK